MTKEHQPRKLGEKGAIKALNVVYSCTNMSEEAYLEMLKQIKKKFAEDEIILPEKL